LVSGIARVLLAGDGAEALENIRVPFVSIFSPLAKPADDGEAGDVAFSP
jgi:hypothetical protein